MSPAPLRIAGVLLLAMSPLAASGQHPLRHFADAFDARHDARHPVVRYSLRVDTTGHGAFEVEVHMRNVADSFRLAMAAHPEYDDRYWRYVEGLRVTRPRQSNSRLSSYLGAPRCSRWFNGFSEASRRGGDRARQRNV